MARGLEGLLSRGGGIRGGAWADHLFVVGGGVTDRKRVNEAVLAEMRAEVERESAGKSGTERLVARMRAGSKYAHRLRADADVSEPDTDAEMGGLSWVSFHPSLPSRLKRLRAMGAHVREGALGKPHSPAQIALMVAIFAPLALLIAFLLSVVVVLSTGLTIVFMMIPMAIVYAVFEWLF